MERMCYDSAGKNQIFPLGAVKILLSVSWRLILIYSISVFMDFFFLIYIFFPVCIGHADGLPHSKSGLRKSQRFLLLNIYLCPPI